MYYLDNSCLQSSSIDVNINNGLNNMIIVQSYEVRGNASLEVYYKFPVPNNYSITGFKINIGDKLINGMLKEKSQAINNYNEAILEGNSGFLLQTCNNEQLECCLGNITPGTNVLVTITLVGELRCEYNSNTYRLIIPTTVGNKYSPNSIPSQDYTKYIINKLSTIQNSEDSNCSMSIHFDINMNGGIKIIKYNDRLLYPTSDQYQFDIQQTNLDQDIIVIIERKSVSSHAISNNNTKLTNNKYKYATYLNIIPEPSSLSKVESDDIHYCLVLDRSGSMLDDMNLLKEAAKTAINILPPECAFDVYAFSNEFERFTCDTTINTEYRSKSIEWINNLKCFGGTEIIPVLTDVYHQIERTGKMGSIIFLSDGDVSNGAEIVDLIKYHPNVRVFTLGIGTCVSEKLINDMAEAGMGTCEFAANIQDTLEPKLASIVLKAQTSLSTNNNYTLNVESSGSYEIIPKPLPPLFGNHNNIFYIFSENPIINIIYNNNIIVIDHHIDHNIINSIAANKYIKHLYDNRNFGNISQIPHLRDSINDEWKKQIISCSLDNNVLSEFTSFIAVEHKNDKTTDTLQLIEIPLQPPARSYNRTKSSNGGLSGLFALATSMMEKMGCRPPPNIKPPSENEISAVINTVFNNETTQNAIQARFNSFNESPLQTDLIEEIFAKVEQARLRTSAEQPIIDDISILTSIDPMKISYVKSGDLLISVEPCNLSLLCEGPSPKLQLKYGDIVDLIGITKFKVILVGSDTEKWVLKCLVPTL